MESYQMSVTPQLDRIQASNSEKAQATELTLNTPKLVDALQQKLARIQLVTDALDAKVSYVDANQRFQFVNQNYQEWFKIPMEEIIGKTIAELLGPKAYAGIEGYLEAALAGDRNVSYEFTETFADGETRILAVHYTPHFNAAGEVLGLAVVCQDITRYKKLQTTIQQLETARV